jgi:hypothetical protein
MASSLDGLPDIGAPATRALGILPDALKEHGTVLRE